MLFYATLTAVALLLASYGYKKIKEELKAPEVQESESYSKERKQIKRNILVRRREVAQVIKQNNKFFLPLGKNANQYQNVLQMVPSNRYGSKHLGLPLCHGTRKVRKRRIYRVWDGV